MWHISFTSRQSTPPATPGDRAARGSAAPADRLTDTCTAVSPDTARNEALNGLRRGHVIAGRYKLVHLLGRGAMGEVWRARDGVLRFDVALKFITIPLEGQIIDVMDRFRFEAQLSAQLGRKTRYVVAVHDVGEDPAAGPYIVMGYVRGRSLRQWMNAQGPVSPAALSPILCQIGEALSVAHHLGIVHRDIKPGNVLVAEERDGRPCAKVADFGIAKWVRQELPADFPRKTASGVVLGTPAYLSPEHACDGDADPHSDMWALAVVAYEALCGRQPFPGRNVGDVLASILNGARPPLSTLCPEASPELEEWFVRAFALDPVDRFPSVEQMLDAYKAAVVIPDAPVQPEPDAQVPAGSAHRRKLRLAGVGLVVALGTALALSAAVLPAQGDRSAALQASVGAARAAARILQEVQARDAQTAGSRSAGATNDPAPERPNVSPLPPRAAAQPARAPATTQNMPQKAGAAAPSPQPRTGDSWKSTIF